MSFRLCLIGAGRIGRIHAGNIAAHPDASLHCVVDADPKASADLANRTGAKVCDLDRALADDKVDAVVIASSTDTHLPLIEACAAAGKPVFCEKPLDLDSGNARRCIELAREGSILLFVGFNRRYDPSFRKLRQELKAGAIGAIEVLTITSRDPSPPPLDYVKRSGGLFRDMMIHDFDMARWLLGAEPTAVFATGSCLVDDAIGRAGDVDTAAVILETATGAVCQITNSRRCSYGYDQRIEAFGAIGMLRADNETATRVEVANANGFLKEPALPFFLERYRSAYRLEMDDFLRALGGEAHDLAGGEDGLRALLLADAAERSRRAQVRVPTGG
jgi:myo-inositol 2-dehydrogenase/D-chiro-inositol 1-dehydrogenase